jgi:hypothetical protein
MKPFPALLVRPPLVKGYSDSCGVSAVTVLQLDRAGERALVGSRCGSVSRRFWARFDELASTPEDAAKKLAPHLSALAGRAALSAVPVTTPAEAVTKKQ